MRAYTPDHELAEQVVPECHLHVTVHLHLFIYGGSRCITLKGLLVATTHSVGKRKFIPPCHILGQHLPLYGRVVLDASTSARGPISRSLLLLMHTLILLQGVSEYLRLLIYHLVNALLMPLVGGLFQVFDHLLRYATLWEH